jgi:hypothetical protein
MGYPKMRTHLTLTITMYMETNVNILKTQIQYCHKYTQLSIIRDNGGDGNHD